MSAPRFPIAAVLAWGGAACLAIGAWLAVPGGTSGSRGHREVLIDESPSAVASRPSTWRAAVHAAVGRAQAEARAAGRSVDVSLYGRGGGALPEDRADWSRSDGGHVEARDLAGALGSLLRDGHLSKTIERIDVIFEGTWSGRDPSRSAAELTARGVEIVRIVLPPPEIDDVGIAPLASPLRVRAGEPLAIEVELWWWPSAPSTRAAAIEITADLSQDGRNGRTTHQVALPVPDPALVGPLAVRAHVDLPPLESARARLDLRVNPVDGRGRPYDDPLFQDDTTSLVIEAEGTLTLGLAGDPTARDSVRALLTPLPADMALVDVESFLDLVSLDVLVTADELFELDEGQLLTAFVSAGGGWLDLAGTGFTGGLRPSFAALQPAPEDSTQREIVVLVDASGSMAGEPSLTARAALARLVELAPVTDGLSALWFSAESSSPVDLGRPGERADSARRRAIFERIGAAPDARGPTRLWAALEALADTEADRAAQRKTFAILVTDGRDPERADFAARAAALRTRLAGVRVELAVIAAGPDPDRELLAALAGDPARVLDAGDLTAPDSATRLATLLQRAASQGAIVEDDRARAAYASSAEGPAASFRDLAPPTLRRFVRARARADAQVAWVASSSRAETPTGPLLAFARHGLGQVAGLAFLPDPTWVREPNDLGAALATALRAIAPPADRARPRLVERDGDLVLEDVGAATPAIVRATFASERGEQLGDVELLAARANHDPLHARSARLPPALADLAAGERVLVTIDMGSGSPPLQTAFVAPRASEFARLPGVFEPPQRVAEAARTPGNEPHPAAPAFLLLGLLGIAAAACLGLFSRFAR